MANSLMKRSTLDRTLSLFKLSSSFLRSFSSATPSSASTPPNPSESSEKQKPKKKKKKNLFEVAEFLPNWGIGYHMAKSHWVGVSYEITKINLYKSGNHGKAWGIVYKGGVKKATTPKKISGVNKRCWRYVPTLPKPSGIEPAVTEPTENTPEPEPEPKPEPESEPQAA